MKLWVALVSRGVGIACFALACALACSALVLLAAEQSGWLADWARAEVREHLGGSGAEFELASLELDWFTPAVRIEDLELGEGGRQVAVQRAVIVLAPFAPKERRIRSVLVQGGRVRLSPELLETLASLGPERGAAAVAAPPLLESMRQLPPIEVRGVQFVVVHPVRGDIPLGKVDATFALDAAGRAELSGVLAPSLASAGNDAALVVLHGRVERPSVLSLEFTTRALPLASSALPEDARFDGLRAWQPAGELALAARAELSLDPAEASSLDLRARLANGSLTRAATGFALRECTIDLEARCRPVAGSDWFDPQAWTAYARGAGRWKDAELQASARYGLAAGAGRTASAELSVASCDFSRESLEELGLWERSADTYVAISPYGKADVCAGVVLGARGDWSGAVDVRIGGELQATYEGWTHVPSGTREGFPLTVGHLKGRVAAAFDPRQVRRFEVGLLALTGQSVDERERDAHVRVDGRIAGSLPDAFDPSQAAVLLDFQGRDLSPGAAVRKAVEGLSGTKWIWPAFRPSQAHVSGSGRLMTDSRSGMMAGRFEIEVEDAQLTWTGLPVSVEHASGKLGLHFDPRSLFGVTFDLAGRTATADAVSVRGRVQQDPALAPPPRVRGVRRTLPPNDERDLLMDFEVGVREISLRGSDRDVIATTWPGVGKALEMFQPLGKADVGVRATRARPKSELAIRAEIEPRGAQITPTSFSTTTSNVTGRVLVRGTVTGEAGASAITTRIAPLVGEWPQEARVACQGVFPSSGTDHLELRGAGIDITNRALVGAFREAFASGTDSRGFDLGALSIDGRIDFAADVDIEAPPGGVPRTDGVYRVFLRDNTFRAEVAPPPGRREGPGFGLSGLWGELVQRGGVLTGEHIEAVLGKTAVTLQNARFVDEAGVPRFTTSVQARGIPLDREHLGLFLDPDTVNAAIDRLHLTGKIDFEPVTLDYVGKSERGGPKLTLKGEVRPREAYVDLGLPLAIERARVDLSELVLEGGHVRAWARVAGLVGSIAGRKLQGARMLVTYVQPRLSLLDLTGELEDGRITDLSQVDGPGGRARTSASGPAFTMDLLDPYRFELGLALRNVELGGLMRGMFQTEFADTGFLDAEIRLEGSLEKLTGITGDGWVVLRETRLWSVPVMRDLFSQLGVDSTVVFESMRSRFALEGGVIRMDAMHLASSLLQLVGSGTLDLDGRLSHDLQVRFGVVDHLGPVTRLWYWIQNSLLSISVRGDMSRPKVILKGALSFFQSSGSGERELPLPSLAPLPARF